jgi:hypothetical protein
MRMARGTSQFFNTAGRPMVTHLMAACQDSNES